MRNLLVFTALLVFCASAIGCGVQPTGSTTKKFSGENKAVAQAVSDFQQAVGGRQTAKICGQIFSKELQGRLNKAGKGGCEAAVSSAIADANDFSFTVKDVNVTADKATARVTSASAKGQPMVLSFVKQSGGWRLAGFGAPPAVAV